MNKRKQKYLAYLRSSEWAKIKVDLITINEGKCERCGNRRNLQVHHLTYENLYYEEPDDLILLCGSCHRKEHGLIKKKKKRKYWPKKKKNKKPGLTMHYKKS